MGAMLLVVEKQTDKMIGTLHDYMNMPKIEHHFHIFFIRSFLFQKVLFP
jgi:hypothetical protein